MPPLEFPCFETADVSDWQGEPDHKNFREITEALRAAIAKTADVDRTPAQPPSPDAARRVSPSAMREPGVGAPSRSEASPPRSRWCSSLSDGLSGCRRSPRQQLSRRQRASAALSSAGTIPGARPGRHVHRRFDRRVAKPRVGADADQGARARAEVVPLHVADRARHRHRACETLRRAGFSCGSKPVQALPSPSMSLGPARC
jgi:hypothetical protein